MQRTWLHTAAPDAGRRTKGSVARHCPGRGSAARHCPGHIISKQASRQAGVAPPPYIPLSITARKASRRRAARRSLLLDNMIRVHTGVKGGEGDNLAIG
eukprot:364213-Chlamydomonas_euryale.AAC.8